MSSASIIFDGSYSCTQENQSNCMKKCGGIDISNNKQDRMCNYYWLPKNVHLKQEKEMCTYSEFNGNEKNQK